MSQHSWPFLLNIFCTILKKNAQEPFGGFWGASVNLQELWCVFMWSPDVEQKARSWLSSPAHAGLRCPVKPLKWVREGCGERLSALSSSIKWPFWTYFFSLSFPPPLTPSMFPWFLTPLSNHFLPTRSLSRWLAFLLPTPPLVSH